MAGVRSYVREHRQRAGLAQRDLAARVGVSRQSLGAIEAGTAVPSTAVALELARSLACRVEDLFAVSEAPLAVRLASPSAHGRVSLGWVGGRWVAHAASASAPADGIASARRVRPLRDVDALRANLLVAGCDPALGLLAGHLLDGPRVHLHWIPTASGAALDALAAGLVHVAGVHLIDPATGAHNLPAIRARLGGRGVVVVNLAGWEQGFVARRGRRVRGVRDLAAGGLRVVLREPGSGARALLDRLLADAGVPLARLTVAETAAGHLDVARSVASGHADVGVATAAAAAAFGLDFAPLAADRFDLVLLAETAAGASGQRLLDALAGSRFQRDAGALPGYATTQTGQIMERLAA